ncbi:hypothetical protein TIFTF001_053850, partial [Ficus carica]
MLNGLVHGLNWIGLAASTTPWLCATVSNLPAILDQDYREMALQTVKLMVWVRKSFMYDGNKLPRVVPTRT